MRNPNFSEHRRGRANRPQPSYSDFFLIFNGRAGRYTVEAYGPRAISVSPQAVDLKFPASLREQLDRIRQGEAPAHQHFQAIGSRLYQAAFPHPIALAYARASAQLPEEAYLRLKLLIRPPELNALPWELLYDPAGEIFLAPRRTYSIVRFIEGSIPTAPLSERKPLRILSILSSPQDLPLLNLPACECTLRQAIGEKAEISLVSPPTLAMLRKFLRQPFHVLHYDGHAFYTPETQSGALCLEDEHGNAQAVSGEMLATYLAGTTIRLVVLAACESGADGRRKRSSGLAHRLMVTSNLPAVVAMQFQVSDEAAIAFQGGFYEALAENYPLDAAMAEGRKAILETLGGDPLAAADWAAPVLFARGF